MMKKMVLAVMALGVLSGLYGCSSTAKKDGDQAASAEPVTAAEKQAGVQGGLPVTHGDKSHVEVLPIDQATESGTVVALSADEMQADDTHASADLAYPPVVYFDYDSDVVSEAGRQVLKYYADKLLAQPDIRVRLEGHTDERGAPEYNLALGERRAKAVKEVLVLYGVDPSRIDIVSYGEARPAVEGHDESAWAKNRRVELVFVQ